VRLYQDEQLKMLEVARRLGLTEWCVWKTLHREGVPLRPKGRLKGSWNTGPLVWLDEARRLYEGGHSLVKVAAAVGLSARKLRYHFQKASIPCRKRGRPGGITAEQKNAVGDRGSKKSDHWKKDALRPSARSHLPQVPPCRERPSFAVAQQKKLRLAGLPSRVADRHGQE
jgi:hypothetical protein